MISALRRWRSSLARLFGGGGLGARGERAAWRHLRRRGYTLVGMNLRLAGAEADLVLLTPDGQTLVVAEVKTLASSRMDPRERVDATKRRRLERVALCLLRQAAHRGRSARFDVLGVRPRWFGMQVRHVEGAWREGE